jgi:uncharacterized protein YerC
MEAIQFYESRIETLTEEQKILQKRKSVFGMLRLGSILLIIAIFYFVWGFGKIYAIIGVILAIAAFIKLIHKDLVNRAAIKHVQKLIDINKNELAALGGKQSQFYAGEQFAPHDHFYANDMDVFGRASLFQYLNRTTSELGAEKLATWLLAPAAVADIIARQDAVKELATLGIWTQNIQALGKESSIKKSTSQQLENWIKQPNLFLQFKHWQWLRILLPAIILAITALYSFNIVAEKYWYLSLFIFSVIAFQINKVVAPLHNQLSSMVDDLNTLSESIASIEKQNFVSPLLQQLKKDLQKQNINASATIKRLKKILDRLDLRYNIVISVPLNILLLWTLQQVLNLEKWKKENNENIGLWFDTLASFEVLHSFATIHFNNSSWCFPTLLENHFQINATALGHPLIHQNKRINNYIHIKSAGEIMLVTGSNMAGKSTYLRSIGINVILTMAGAPVCAKSFEVSPVQLLSSMRIADNLEESTSTFYAELKKLKTVIEKINAKEKVFVLLDEILRGTNSLDRHTGSEALIKQLIKQKAAAILATHDVALAALEKEYPTNILNFHFDAQVNGEELYFDYKLKNDVCTNMNASILMKKIGLEL